jgi:hypothetical protein
LLAAELVRRTEGADMKYLACAVAVLLAGTSATLADPGKDESGKGKDRYTYDSKQDRPAKRARAEARIPKGHMPPPGECRTWYEGRPAGHQPPPYKCRW